MLVSGLQAGTGALLFLGSAILVFVTSCMCRNFLLKSRKCQYQNLKESSAHGLEKIPAITVNYSFKICCITNALGTKDDIVGGKHSYHFEMKSSSEKLVSGGKKGLDAHCH